MPTYLVCQRDALHPFNAQYDSPEAIAIEIAIAIEHAYCENELSAYEASSHEALMARLADKALYELKLDESLIHAWSQEARAILHGYDNLNLQDEFFHTCNDIDRKTSKLSQICEESNYFDGIDFDIDKYLDKATTEYFNDIEYFLQKKFTNLFSFKALASNA